DLEDPLGGVLVGLPGLGHHAADLGVVGVAVVGLGQAVVERAADLPAGDGGVEARVDVLGRAAREGGQVDDLAALGELALVDGGLGPVVAVGGAPAGVVIVTACGGDERQAEGE